MLLVVARPFLLAAPPLSLQLQIRWHLPWSVYVTRSIGRNSLTHNILHYEGRAAHVYCWKQDYYISTFDSCYQLPSCPAVTTSLEQRCWLCIHRYMKKYMSSWGTSSFSLVSGLLLYLSFTIHYINDNWKLQSTTLQSLYMPQNHIGSN